MLEDKPAWIDYYTAEKNDSTSTMLVRQLLSLHESAPLNLVEQTTVMPRRTTPTFPCPCGNFGHFMRGDITTVVYTVIMLLDSQNILHTQNHGCNDNVTCISDNMTSLYGYWGDIQKPIGVVQPYFTLETSKDGSNHELIDLYEYFGIECQDDKRFYATKFPNGISYFTYDGRLIYVDEGLEDKKTQIHSGQCAPLPPM
uniref:Cell wall-binding protein n=1 Tax=Caenorhabditis tropicalis TaxID=1561998 RepID=A0A1I7TGV8_9PELO